jgi:hypothetical protein
VALGVFALVTSEFLPASVLTPLAADLDVSVGAAGQAVTATAVVGAIAAPLTPVLTGRLDRRLVMWGLMALLCASNLLTVFAANLPMLLVARVLLGASLGGFWSMAAALAMRLVPAKASATRDVDRLHRRVGGDGFGRAGRGLCQRHPGLARGVRDRRRGRRRCAAGSTGDLADGWRRRRFPACCGPAAGGRRPSVAVALVGVLLVISGHFAGFTYVRPVLEQVDAAGRRSDLADAAGLRRRRLLRQLRRRFAGRSAIHVWRCWAALSLMAASALAIVTLGVSAGGRGRPDRVGLRLRHAAGRLPGLGDLGGFRPGRTGRRAADLDLPGGDRGMGAVFGGVLVDQFGPLSAPAYAAVSALAAVGLVLALRSYTARAQASAAACEACS